MTLLKSSQASSSSDLFSEGTPVVKSRAGRQTHLSKPFHVRSTEAEHRKGNGTCHKRFLQLAAQAGRPRPDGDHLAGSVAQDEQRHRHSREKGRPRRRSDVDNAGVPPPGGRRRRTATDVVVGRHRREEWRQRDAVCGSSSRPGL
jgi:hypothetical protein